MRIRMAACMVILGITSSAWAEPPASQPRSSEAAGAARPDPQIAVQEPLPHLLYLPPEYGKDGNGKTWPLVLFLHGKGESGRDLERVKRHGPPRLVHEGRHFPFILVSPQTDHGWKPSELGALLDRIESRYAVDRRREYVTGLSMGGFGTWAMLAAFPGRFAAGVMICGGGDPAEAEQVKGTPLWVFHGEKDRVVPIERSRTDVEALKKLGAEVQFTTYPDAEHDSWTQTYNNPKVYRWLLRHRRDRAATSPASGPGESKPRSQGKLKR